MTGNQRTCFCFQRRFLVETEICQAYTYSYQVIRAMAAASASASTQQEHAALLREGESADKAAGARFGASLTRFWNCFARRGFKRQPGTHHGGEPAGRTPGQ